MSRIVKAFAIFALVFTFVQMTLHESVAAEQSTADAATKDAAAVKTCLDFVEAKTEEETARKQKEAENEAPVNIAPNVTKGEQKTGPEAYLEAAAQSKPHFAYENCIGIVSDACMETEDAQTTYGMMGCFGRESEVWDARLNTSYREQTETNSKKPEDKTEAKHLRNVQTAWIPWRDATCEVLYSNGIPLYGSQAKIEGVYCIMLLTARQALWMEGKTIISFDQ
jgi:uncharacterized protein YecT (DUF1311 family)